MLYFRDWFEIAKLTVRERQFRKLLQRRNPLNIFPKIVYVEGPKFVQACQRRVIIDLLPFNGEFGQTCYFKQRRQVSQ